MTDTATFKLSPALLNDILNNNFGLKDSTFSQTEVYIGLGITFDEETFTFTSEPVSEGFTILPDPVVFTESTNGIIRNAEALEWPKATVNWTEGSDTINYLGLYYREEVTGEDESVTYNYTLIAVLPLTPAETVSIKEQVTLNAGTIQIRLTNR